MKSENQLSFTVIIILLYFCSYFGRGPISFFGQDILESFNQKLAAQDGESRLSMGLPLNLATAGVYELTLLDRITEKMAMKLVEVRFQLIKTSADSGTPLRKALEDIRGIGPKTSQYLDENLEVDLYR